MNKVSIFKEDADVKDMAETGSNQYTYSGIYIVENREKPENPEHLD